MSARLGRRGRLGGSHWMVRLNIEIRDGPRVIYIANPARQSRVHCSYKRARGGNTIIVLPPPLRLGAPNGHA